MFANSNPSVEATLASIDKVDAAAFSKVCSLGYRVVQLTYLYIQFVAGITKVKPTFVAVGNVQALPFADEVGL